MTEAIDQLFLQIYEYFRNPNPEQKEQIDSILLELYSNPLIFHSLFNFALNHENPNVRLFSIMVIDKALKSRYSQQQLLISPEEAQLIMQLIVEFLQKYKIENQFSNVLQMGCELARIYPIFSDLSPLLIQSFLEMFQNPENLLISLMYASILLEFEILTDEILNSNNFAEIFLNLILQGLSFTENDTNSFKLRLNAIHLLTQIKLNGCPLFADFIKSSPMLLQALMQTTQISVCQNESPEESLRLFCFLEFIVTLFPEELAETLPEYFTFCYSKIQDVSIQPEIRENILQFFQGCLLSSTNMDFFEENVDQLLEIIFNIVCCKCENDPELFQMNHSDKLLEIIANDPDFVDLVYSVLMDKTIAAQNEGNTVQFKAGLCCLAVIVEDAHDAFSCHNEEVGSIIIAAFETDNPLIYSDVCHLVHLLSQSSFDSILAIFDRIIQYLLKYITHRSSLPCLERLLSDSNQPPSDYSSITQTLLSLINGETADTIVQCISNIVKSINHMDEDYYELLKQALVTIIQTYPDARQNVYECFANCTNIAPRIISEDIVGISGFMIQDLSNQPSFDMIDKAALATSEIVRIIPQTFSEQALNFTQIFSMFLEQNIQNVLQDEGEGEDEDDFGECQQLQETCGNVLVALSDLVSAYTQQLAAHAPPIIETINKFLTSQEPELIIGAAQSITALSPLFTSLGIHPNTLVTAITDVIDDKSRDPDSSAIIAVSIQDLFSAFTAILYHCGTLISDEALLKAGTFITECLDLKVSIILDSQSKSIENDFQISVIQAMEAFILGGAFSNYNEKTRFLEILMKCVNDSRGKKLMQSNACSTVAEICYIMPEQSNETATILVQSIFTKLSANQKMSIQCRISYYRSLMFLLMSHSALFTLEMVANIAQMVIGSYQAEQMGNNDGVLISSVLLLIAFAVYHVPISDEVLSSCLSKAPSIDSEYLPIFTHCLLLIYKIKPEIQNNALLGKLALHAIASSDWCISKIENSEFQFLVDFVKSGAITQEMIFQLMEYNQSIILKIQQKLA